LVTDADTSIARKGNNNLFVITHIIDQLLGAIFPALLTPVINSCISWFSRLLLTLEANCFQLAEMLVRSTLSVYCPLVQAGRKKALNMAFLGKFSTSTGESFARTR
jgi:hypothetical protein